MNYIKDQKGVALLLELLLGAVVLLAAGFAIFYYIHNKPTMNSRTASVSSPSASASPTPSTTASSGYFTIPQWDVRAPYNGTDKFTYTLGSQNGGNALATVISGNLAATDPGCAQYGAGQIIRASATALASNSFATDSNLTVAQYAQQNPNAGFVHIGNYYYLFQHDQASCTSNGDASMQNTANDTVQALVAKLAPVN